MKTKLRFMISLLLLVLIVFAVVNSFGQTLPLVYDVENTGASCTPPPLPAPGQLTSYANLPDPFAWSNGSGRIQSFDDWKCRRNEIKGEIEKYEIGVKPPKPSNITATFSGTTLTVKVTENGQTLTLTSNITIPSGTGPFPAIIGMNAPTGNLPSGLFSGVIQIPFNHDQVVTYANGSGSINSADPYFKLYPNTNIGKYSAWSWGISRLIDGLELVQAQVKIDMKRIGITGCSYAGKMALFGAAFDERIALCLAQESGGGGVNSWRVSETIGNVEKIDNTNYSWFMPSLKTNFQAPNVGKLPHDHHELIAMIAPRAILILGNPDYTWLGDESGYVSAKAAQEVWKTFGIPERFGFSFRGGHSHCSLPSASNSEVTAFVDKFLRNSSTANTNIAVHPFASTNYLKWIDAWDGYTIPLSNTNAPKVTITAPAANAKYDAGATVTITATVTDADNNVSKVEFFSNGTKIGEDAASPYSFAWTNVAEGAYTITAIATDATNNKGTSTAVAIVVGNPRKPLITNGEFDQGTTGWELQNNSSATGTITVVTNGNLSGTNSLKICTGTSPGTLDWHVQVRQNAPIVAGKNYRVSFIAKADAARPMTVSIQHEGDPWTTYFNQIVDLTTTAQTFTFDFNADVTDATTKLKFYLGGNASCVTIDKVEVNEGEFVLSAAVNASGSTTFCAGGSVVLNANAGTGYGYQWKKDGSNIASANAASYTATQPGSYSVAISANNQNATSAPVVVTVNAVPAAPVTAPATYCQNATAGVLSATGSSLKWYTTSGGGTASSAAPTPLTTAPGTTNYYVTQTVSGCESARAVLAVTVNGTPAAPAVTTPVSYCQNAGASTLSATGTSLSWYTVSTGGTGSATAPTPATAAPGTTVYYVSQKTNGCEGPRATINVTVNGLPSAVITPGGPTSFVEGESVVLNANTGAGLSYRWLKGTAEVGTGVAYTATSSGSYSVEVKNASGCKATSTAAVITANPNQPSVIAVTSPANNSTVTGSVVITADISDPDGAITLVEFLAGNTVLGTSSSGPYNYTWNNPAPGTHTLSVRVTDSHGGTTTSSQITFTTGVTGIHAAMDELIGNVYPVPAKDLLTIEMEMDLSGATFTVLNVLGEEIALPVSVSATSAKVDVSSLTEGSYMLIVRKDMQMMRRKFSKQ